MALNCSNVPFVNGSCFNSTSLPLTTAATTAATALNDKQKIRIAIYVLSIILSWIGNSLVILVSVLNRQSLSPCRILMAHLAVTNLLFSIRLPFQIRLEVNGYVWEWGRFYCKVMHGFNSASLLASIETVTVIAIERYRGISKPYASKWSNKNIIISILIVWGIALLTYSPYMYYLEIRGIYCSDSYPSLAVEQAYSVIIFIFRYVIPLGIMSYCYFKVGLVIHRRPTRVSTHQNKATEVNRKRENMRIIQILVVIVVAFAILTAPLSIWWLWYVFGGTDSAVALDLVGFFVISFLYLHSAINPVIYGIMDKKFKKGVRELFSSCFKNPETNGSVTNQQRVVTFVSKV